MSVRCKFRVDSIEKTLNSGSEMWNIRMAPVYPNNDPNHENSQFWKWSPSGSFVLGTVNPAAVAQLELGKEYYIDISPAGG